jgi:hypothetical protein
MAKKILIATCVLAVCLVLVQVTPARAQSVLEGKIAGTITDDKGEPLPGVAVELAGPSIMGKRATVTSARGTYVFLNVPPGTFTMTATMPGFKKYVQEDIILGAGKALEINPILQMGTIEETVTVLAASPVVDVKTSTVDSRLEKELLAKLPTSRDAFYDLATTTPGMFDVGSSGSWLPSPTAYGGSSMENVFLVNGVNTTNPRGAAFGSLVKVNYNAVEEVRVVALGAKAEYGSYSGAAIDVLTKSGSNTFHGNVAYYTELRGGFFKYNQPGAGAISGAPWLFIQQGDVLAGKTLKNWEGNVTLGGPIIKDRVWFYGAYDYLRSSQLPVNWSIENGYWGRWADFKLSAEPFQNHRAWISYHNENNKGTGWSWGSEPEWDTTMTYGVRTKNNTLSGQWQFLPTSNLIVTGKYLGFWTDDRPFIPSDHPSHPGYINWWKWAQYGVNGAFPYVEAQKSMRQTIQGDLSYYAEDFLGEHDIKFGVQFTKGRGNWMGGYFQNYVNFAYPVGWAQSSGTATYNGQTLSGYTVQSIQNETWYYGGAMAGGLLFYNNRDQLNPFLTVRTADSLGFFFDDQWSPTKRLTFNIGLRYDRMSTKYGVGKVYEFVTSPEEINGPPPVVRDRAATGNIFDFKTFSPRLGITYQLTKDGKTVIRASYGRYYMPLAVEFLRRFGPDMALAQRNYEIWQVPWNLVDLNNDGLVDTTWYTTTDGRVINEVVEAAKQIYDNGVLITSIPQTVNYSWTLAVQEGVKDQYTDQFNLNFERELFKDFSLSLTYIYKHAANLYVNVPINRVTGEEWEYERVPFHDDVSGNTVDLYSIVLQDYNGGGIDTTPGSPTNDINWIGNNNTFEVQNMQSYDGHKAQRTFQAIQLVLNKRFSNRYQGLVSMLYSWSNGTAQRTMRQNDNMQGPMVTDDTWMGNLNYTINNMNGPLPFVPVFEFKASGSYTIPKVEVDFGLRFRMHTGRPIWKLASYPIASLWSYTPDVTIISPGGLAQVIMGDADYPDNTKPRRFPSAAILDLRFEKAVRLSKYGQVSIVLDAFNVFNVADVLQADYFLNYGRVTGITDARRFRLSFMYQF